MLSSILILEALVVPLNVAYHLNEQIFVIFWCEHWWRKLFLIGVTLHKDDKCAEDVAGWKFADHQDLARSLMGIVDLKLKVTAQGVSQEEYQIKQVVEISKRILEVKCHFIEVKCDHLMEWLPVLVKFERLILWLLYEDLDYFELFKVALCLRSD